MDAPYPSEAVGKAHSPISHAHIYGRLLTYIGESIELPTF